MHVVWTGLLAGAGTLFTVGAVLEFRALWNERDGDTLSEYLRPWAKEHKCVVTLMCGTLAGLLIWLPPHLFNWW